MKPSILAFIPARSGSKRLPRKNLSLIEGKPLVAWTIDAALRSKYDMTVFVSTESQEIAEVARKYGADVPFLRSIEFASDFSHPFEAHREALKNYEFYGESFDFTIILQPTSPLRNVEDIDQALDLLTQNYPVGCRSVISVTEMKHPSEWIFGIDVDGTINGFIRKSLNSLTQRSQDLKVNYRLNGAIYAGAVQDLLKYESFYIPNGNVLPLFMPENRSVDIDTISDLEFARFLIRNNALKPGS